MKVRHAQTAARGAPPGGVAYLNRDESLVAGLKNRDPAALEALFDRYAPLVQRILARILGSSHCELDDCLQETFATAFYKARQLQEPRHLKPWLTRIAVHRALDQLRKRKRDRWLLFFAPESLPAVPAPPHDMDDTEALFAVYAIFDAIPDKERVAFTLRRLERMTIPEIAVSCGVSQATVKRRIAAAQRRFEKLAMATPALQAWLSEREPWRER